MKYAQRCSQLYCLENKIYKVKNSWGVISVFVSLFNLTSLQDVFLMIRRHKTTIFTDAKESTTVYELKRIVEGILKRPPEDQRLYKVIILLVTCKLQYTRPTLIHL